jgi:hypothetical protein
VAAVQQEVAAEALQARDSYPQIAPMLGAAADGVPISNI